MFMIDGSKIDDIGDIPENCRLIIVSEIETLI